MASGNGPEENLEDGDSPAPAAELLEAPPRPSTIDPVVDSAWLGRRPRTPTGRRPRWSTVLLIAAFIAVLILYLLLQTD